MPDNPFLLQLLYIIVDPVLLIGFPVRDLILAMDEDVVDIIRPLLP